MLCDLPCLFLYSMIGSRQISPLAECHVVKQQNCYGWVTLHASHTTPFCPDPVITLICHKCHSYFARRSTHGAGYVIFPTSWDIYTRLALQVELDVSSSVLVCHEEWEGKKLLVQDTANEENLVRKSTSKMWEMAAYVGSRSDALVNGSHCD